MHVAAGPALMANVADSIVRGYGAIRKVLGRVKQDSYSRHLALWHVIMPVPYLAFIPIGGGFAFQGKASYSQDPYVIFLQTFPHSLRIHGIILMVIGMVLFASQVTILLGETTRGWLVARIGLIAAGCYSIWCIVAFLGATWVNGKYTSGMFWYLATLVACGGLSILAPFNKARTPDART